MAPWKRSSLVALVALSLSISPAVAQNAQSGTQNAQAGPALSDDDTLRIVKEVRKRLLSLTNYSVFDWLTFGIHGKNIVLRGYASRPTLKSDAERAVKTIPGVASVENEIEVLPNSPNDDRIRVAVYNRMYTYPALRRYNANQGSVGRAIGPGPNIAAMAGGITQSPPIGFHAIHIIVKNGNVMLFGYVDRQSDADIAYMQANGTPGTFSVQNELEYPGAGTKPAAAKAK
jgi:osmotically-inducible protein OsmY